MKEHSRALGLALEHAIRGLDEKTRSLKARTITSLEGVVTDLTARAEALREAATEQAELASETVDDVRKIFRDAAEQLDSLRLDSAPSVA